VPTHKEAIRRFPGHAALFQVSPPSFLVNLGQSYGDEMGTERRVASFERKGAGSESRQPCLPEFVVTSAGLRARYSRMRDQCLPIEEERTGGLLLGGQAIEAQQVMRDVENFDIRESRLGRV
jgi:hypothetical protein